MTSFGCIFNEIHFSGGCDILVAQRVGGPKGWGWYTRNERFLPQSLQRSQHTSPSSDEFSDRYRTCHSLIDGLRDGLRYQRQRHRLGISRPRRRRKDTIYTQEERPPPAKQARGQARGRAGRPIADIPAVGTFPDPTSTLLHTELDHEDKTNEASDSRLKHSSSAKATFIRYSAHSMGIRKRTGSSLIILLC